MKNATNRRMPAEWENPESILVTFPSAQTDWAYCLDEAREQFGRLITALLDAGEKLTVICAPEESHPALEAVAAKGGTIVRDIPFNDTWTRDYGPITVEEDGKKLELDFGFNGWGLKFAADRDNLVNLRMTEKEYDRRERYVNERDFTLEGGSIESDGRGTIMTTSSCLCSPNRNGGKSKEELEPILKNKLGAERILWVDHGSLAGDDTDSHIDTLARLAPDDTILYVAPPVDTKDEHYAEMKKMEEQLKSFRTADGQPFRLIPLPFAKAVYDEEGNRLPATYANYLVTATNLFVPVYGDLQLDSEAMRQIQIAFPDHRIFPVDCSTLIKQHGSLHCSTMQLY